MNTSALLDTPPCSHAPRLRKLSADHVPVLRERLAMESDPEVRQALALATGYLIARAIVRSRLGRVMVAVRDAEDRVRFIGYRVERVTCCRRRRKRLYAGTCCGTGHPSAFCGLDINLLFPLDMGEIRPIIA